MLLRGSRCSSGCSSAGGCFETSPGSTNSSSDKAVGVGLTFKRGFATSKDVPGAAGQLLEELAELSERTGYMCRGGRRPTDLYSKLGVG